MGDKELKEYMEVLGYADAAKWAYMQALSPGDWTTGDLVSIQEIRTLHHKAMIFVWGVAPHPDATPAESPGNWRTHEIHPFPEGMTPPSFTEISHLIKDWVDDANALRGPSPLPLAELLAMLHNGF